MEMPWWSWMVLAGILGLAEMHVPGAYLIWMALGAAVTGAVDAAFGISLEGQLGTFAVASAASCVAGYFVYRELHRRQQGGISTDEIPLNERGLSMVGARGTVCEVILNGRGKVRLGDGVWLATGPDLAEGTPVAVTAVHGTRLYVEALNPGGASEPAQAARLS
jgi:inner membrane protein